MKSISLTLNGRQITSTCEVHETLRTLLRSQGMFSVHYGSDSGETGAGAVLLNGELVSSDVVLAVQADGHSITTVEALNTEAELHPIQAAFVAAGAFQSGYSAGAMVLGTLALLEENREHIFHAAMFDPHTAAELDVRQIRAMTEDMLLAHRDWLPGWTQ